MRKLSQKILVYLLSAILVIISCIPAMASTMSSTDDVVEPDIREILENERPPIDEFRSESLELENGTMYLEENYEYRLAYTVYNAGYITYSICYKNNPGVVYTGKYYLDEIQENDTAATNHADDLESLMENNHIVDILLNLEPDEIIDFSARSNGLDVDVPIKLQSSGNKIITTDDAIRFCENNMRDWKTPVNSSLIGAYKPKDITVYVYESVAGRANRECIVKYYANETIESILAAAIGFSLKTLLKCVWHTINVAGEYIAQRNGTLTFFTIDNTRTKTARINGKTYFWSGWDVEFELYSGDDVHCVLARDHAYSDYDNSITYFGQKALESYYSSN